MPVVELSGADCVYSKHMEKQPWLQYLNNIWLIWGALPVSKTVQAQQLNKYMLTIAFIFATKLCRCFTE